MKYKWTKNVFYCVKLSFWIFFAVALKKIWLRIFLPAFRWEQSNYYGFLRNTQGHSAATDAGFVCDGRKKVKWNADVVYRQIGES